MTAPALVFDAETVPLESSMAAPYPCDERKVPANYKAEDAIARWREADEVKWRSERARECSLNPRLGRIVCVGTQFVGSEGNATFTAIAEATEAWALGEAWEWIAQANGQLITFNGLTFDVPFFLVRSLVHGITPTVPVRTVRDWLRRYSYGPHYDCRAVLTQWDNRTTGTLADWCSAFGIQCDDTCKGSDIYALYQAGDFDAIAAHCRSDVEVTAKLYEKVSAMYGGIETPRWRDAA